MTPGVSVGSPRPAGEIDRGCTQLFVRIASELIRHPERPQHLQWPVSRCKSGKDNLQSATRGELQEVDGPQSVLVQEPVVPQPPLSIGVLELVDRRDGSIEVGVVVAAVDTMQ